VARGCMVKNAFTLWLRNAGTRLFQMQSYPPAGLIATLSQQPRVGCSHPGGTDQGGTEGERTRTKGRRLCPPVAYVRDSLHMDGGQVGLIEDGTGMHTRRSSFSYEELLACGRREMFSEGPQLPLPPMLMFDRISEISEQGGEHGKGMARAELDVKPDLWFFACHFKAIPSCRAASASMPCGSSSAFSRLARRRRQRPRARNGRGQIFRPGSSDGQEGRVRHRRQTRDALETGSRHRRWLAVGGRRGDLSALDLKVGLFRQGTAMQPGGA